MILSTEFPDLVGVICIILGLAFEREREREIKLLRLETAEDFCFDPAPPPPPRPITEITKVFSAFSVLEPLHQVKNSGLIFATAPA